MYEAKDKIVLITGGAAGIGRGVVRAFLDEGVKHIAVLDLDVTNGKALEAEMQEKHGVNKMKFYKCDVTTEALETVFNNVIEEYDYIDVVINCAGILNDSPNVYLKQIAVNVTALITSSLKAYNLMRKDKGGNGGTIINISSIMGITQTPFLPVYCATKTAVLQFSNCLGAEMNYSRSGVRVITLCFGCTDTTLLQAGKMESFDKDIDPVMFDLLSKVPFQSPEAAIRGLMETYKTATSGSTWLIADEKPPQDITPKVTEGYRIMSGK